MNDFISRIRQTGAVGSRLLDLLGFATFIACLGVSLSMALNFYLNLATTSMDLYIMFIVAFIQETVKAYALIKGNFSWDYDERKKATRYYFVYAVTLIASIISGVGSGLVVIDKKNATSASVSYLDSIQYKESLVAVELQKIEERVSINGKRKEAQALIPIEKIADIETMQRRIDTTQKEIDKINDTISKYRQEILDLKAKGIEENKNKEKTMYVLIAETFSLNPVVVTAVSFGLLVCIIELGLLVTSIHPKTKVRTVGRPKGSRSLKKSEVETEEDGDEPESPEVEDKKDSPVPESIPIIRKEASIENVTKALFPFGGKKELPQRSKEAKQ